MSWRIGIDDIAYDKEMSRISWLSRKRVFNDLPELYENSLKANDNYYLTRDLLVEELKHEMLVHNVIDDNENLFDNFYLSILDEALTNNKYVYFFQIPAESTEVKRYLKNRIYCSYNGTTRKNWIDELFDEVVDKENWILK